MTATRTGRGVFLSVFLIGLLVMVAVDLFPVRQLIAENRRAEETRAQLLAIQEQNAELEREIENLHTPTEIERIARADFGYVRPGEISYVVIYTDESPVEEQPAPQMAEEVPESSGFWEGLWDYLTGRDMTDG